MWDSPRVKRDVIDAEFRLVRPARQVRFWPFVGFCLMVSMLVGGAAHYVSAAEDKIAVGALVVWAALIVPTWRLLTSAGSRASDEEAEWLRERLRRPER